MDSHAQMETESRSGALSKENVTNEFVKESIPGNSLDEEIDDKDKCLEENNENATNNCEIKTELMESIPVTEGTQEIGDENVVSDIEKKFKDVSINNDCSSKKRDIEDEELGSYVSYQEDLKIEEVESVDESASVPVTEVTKEIRRISSCSTNIFPDLVRGPQLYIENMHGNVILKEPLKKSKVRDPDHLAYEKEKANGNQLLNAVCNDADVKKKCEEVVREFELLAPLGVWYNDNDRYRYLYENLARYLTINKSTRYQFLVKMNSVADITHLCG